MGEREIRSGASAGGADAGDADSDRRAREWIRQRLHPSRRELLLSWAPWIALALAAGLLGWALMAPAPPKRVTIAAGPVDGAYYAFAKRYAETFAANGVTLEVRATAGTVENYRLLASGEANLAIVQGGVAAEGLDDQVRAIASLYYEPVWMFVREERTPNLFKLEGRRIAAGQKDSGTLEITRRLMQANGVADRVTLVPIGGVAAADALRKGDVDVAVFVLSPDAALVKELLGDAGHVRPLNFDRAEAYTRRFRYFSRVNLPRGAIDLARDLPPQDVQLIACAANLVCRADLHPAIVPLAIRAAKLAHERGDLLSEPYQFPSTRYVEWPLDRSARTYFESGPPFLQKYLPFWVAALVDRLKYLLLPLITLVLPLMRIAPPLYVWRMRSRIYRWYRILQELDRHISDRAARGADRAAQAGGHAGASDDNDDDIARDMAVLRVLDRELSERKTVPLSYMQEFYNLRVHVDLLRHRLERQRQAQPSSGPPSEMAP
ncbi:MAG TPA: TAXI family TRAP transporter solute-binding subunit [Tepidisphaeraceae bacterium]|jgi:TRAP transporter TAXI family solute receptor